MRRAGADADADPVTTGSHIDSQPKGGRYDGSYGVLGALEAVQSIKETGHGLAHPVEAVAWSNEEGSRFDPGCMGSLIFAGLEAVEAFAADSLSQETFGTSMYEAFVDFKRNEWNAYHNHVSDWERERYGTMF